MYPSTYKCIYVYLLLLFIIYFNVYTHMHIYGILRRGRIRTQGSKSYLGDLIEKEVLICLPYNFFIQTIFPFGKHCQILDHGLCFVCSHGNFFTKGWSLKCNILILASAEVLFDWRQIGQVWILLSHHPGQGSHEVESCSVVASGS